MDLSQFSIPRHSWIRPGLELRDSALQGKGVFTTLPISTGELVIEWGGVIVSYADFRNGVGLPHSNVGLSETHCLVAPNEDGLTLDDYMNHSCSPNLWLEGPVRLVAIRDVQAGEELTFDYAIEVGHEEYVMKVQCRCQASDCRGRITGRDWRLPQVQRKYAGHFSPFIEERIRQLGE